MTENLECLNKLSTLIAVALLHSIRVAYCETSFVAQEFSLILPCNDTNNLRALNSQSLPLIMQFLTGMGPSTLVLVLISTSTRT